MPTLQIIGTTPAGIAEPTVAIAASRAGGLGIVNLECAADRSSIVQALQQLSRFARGPAGVYLGRSALALFDAIAPHMSPQVSTIIVAADALDIAAPLVARLHEERRSLWVEIATVEQIAAATAAGCDGLIVKGNEAGGWVGEETAFVLLQRSLEQTKLPIWVRGGIGLHTAAACAVAGAAGIVLDSQLSLTPEAVLPEQLRTAIQAMDGSETVCVGSELGRMFRHYQRPDLRHTQDLQRIAGQLAADAAAPAEKVQAWLAAVGERIGWDLERQIVPLGQDVAMAAGLAQRFGTVGGIIAAIREHVDQALAAATRVQVLAPASPLAQSHHTHYPIVQGPMTRVSDQAEFALQVALAGGLPFLAMALMRGPDVAQLLAETSRLLGERPWGVGILGFVPADLRREQLAEIRRVRAPFALIAGGRPDQAEQLEQDGIATYLHVPSPALLRLFLEQGSRRFVFEGRECGGHVGPRSSFVLWEAMTDVLLDYCAGSRQDPATIHVLLAGGIHDGRSAAMATTIVAPLAELGVRVGVLMGTAYLFTEEAVASGAITAGYQEAALQSTGTVLLESGPGHMTRCLPTAFADFFLEEKRRLQQQGAASDAIRDALEALNLGRLRMASKGIARNPAFGSDPTAGRFLQLDAAQQRAEGMYMIGQVAGLRRQVLSIADLHAEVAAGARLLTAAASQPVVRAVPAQADPARIAIIGMACILPGASDLRSFWNNVLNKHDAVTEVPADRWDWQRFFDSNQAARDKIYSRWGGFLQEVPFNPLDYGIPPSSLPSIEPIQLLMLDVVRAGLADAGYAKRPFPRERTGVFVAAGGGLGDLGYLYGFRSYLPHFFADDAASTDVIARLSERLPEWTEDSFPGILLNVIAGRVANRFDFGGANFIVDAACGSGLAALHVAIDDLVLRRSDMAIVGAGDTVQSPFAFLAFSKTQALSARGRCRPFDAEADGIAISEGLAVVVLKRLADAERDGDRIYAVIDGVGASSDGKDRGLTAPRPEGQMRALQRAYERAGYSSDSIGLVEAHGTGTRVGDLVEFESLDRYFRGAQADEVQCALGSVKSMIGHTKATAGLAGLLKVALALYHKVLPPTLVERINPKLPTSGHSLYVNSEVRPWIASRAPRRAGVSAFGFGGTNFHAALEEYRDDFLPPAVTREHLPSELLLWRATDHAQLIADLQSLDSWLAHNAPPMVELAATLYRQSTGQPGSLLLAVVATSPADTRQKLALALERLQSGMTVFQDQRGVFFGDQQAAVPGKVAFLFPGQGSQYPGMLNDLAIQFPLVRAALERYEGFLEGHLAESLTKTMLPPPPQNEAEQQAQRQALTATQMAQPALGAAAYALSELLASFGLQPDMVAGHSYGELPALWRAGVIDAAALAMLSAVRGQYMATAAGPDAGTMAAIAADRATVTDLIAGIDDVTLANMNSPRQTVVSGTRTAVEQVLARCEQRQISARAIPVACAFHSPLVAAAQQQFANMIETVPFNSAQLPVFSNTNAAPYPADPAAMRSVLAEHLIRPVEFQHEVEALYAAGARIFVEVGPQRVLSGLVGQILQEQAHTALALDQPGSAGTTILQRALAQLLVAGVPLKLDALFAGRSMRQLDFGRPYQSPLELQIGPTSWLLNGGRARPAHGPVPQLSPLAVQPAGATAVAGSAPMPAAASAAPNGNGMPPIAHSSGAAGNGADAVMLEYTSLMSHFLETQQRVMHAYLNGAPTAAAPPAPNGTAASPAPAAPPPVPTAEPPAPTAQVAAARSGPPGDEAGLLEMLRELVSERTGYPAAMLDPDADLESDLSVDSIKRVEILGIFRREHPALMAALTGPALEQFQGLRTLRAIVAFAHRQIAAPAAGPEHSPPAVAPNGAAARNGNLEAHAAPIERLAYRFEPAPLPSRERRLNSRPILVTDDGQGCAAALAGLLEQRGLKPVLWRDAAQDLADAVAVRERVAALQQQHGRFGGLLHLAPLAMAADPLAEQWPALRQVALNGLFYLIQALHQDLAETPDGACLLAATGDAMLAAGLAGLLKTAAHELPTVAVRVLSLPTDQEVGRLATRLLRELLADDMAVEVRYSGEQRLTPRVERLPLQREQEQLKLDRASVVLVTGGARGITAQAAMALAERYQPVLLLLGRSPEPPAAEAQRTAALREARDIKAALIDTMGTPEQPPPLATVEAAYRQLMNEREIRANLAALRATGATVHYVQGDVRDEQAFGTLIEQIYARYGRIDGVIHGAGIIEDRLIKDKPADSFERVFTTKIAGARSLARSLQADTLNFLVFFASVAGRFGNRGQADYAAANETLSALAAYLDARWPARVSAISWGPWDSGMVSAELRREFAQRGVSLIAQDVGISCFIDELRFSRKGEAEVMICGADTEVMAATPKREQEPVAEVS